MAPFGIQTLVKCTALLGVFLLVSTPLTFAQTADRVTFTFENDMWGLPRSDENYTWGLAYTRHLAKRPDDSVLRGLFAVHDFIGDTLRLDSRTVNKVSWSLANTNFTPFDITDPSPITDDRPYASLLYLSVGSTNQVGSVVRETGIEVGLLGTNIGYVGQAAIHRACCKDRPPRGWDNQIGDGGAPAFLYRTRWSQPLIPRQPFGSGAFEASWSYGANLGYYARVLGGLSLAYGATPRDLNDLRQVGGDAALKPYKADQGPMPTDTIWPAALQSGPPPRGISLWLDYEVSLFAYNQLLQGSWTGRNRVRFSSSEIERVVHRATVGAELTFIPMWLGLMSGDDGRIYWVQSYKSEDLKGAAGRRHYWGAMLVSWKL